MLDLLNRLSASVQGRFQGIPAGPAHLYDRLASRLLEAVHIGVAREVSGRLGRGWRILEFGCGTGRLMEMVVGRGAALSAVCLDISQAMAGISRRRFAGSGLYRYVDVVLADAQSMPFRDGCFDMVLSTGTLHHIGRPSRLFTECGRVLRRGGEAWIYEFSHDVPREELEGSARLLGGGRLLGVATAFVRLMAALHGIPRREYLAGYVGRALASSGVDYRLEFRGALTKLVIRAGRPG